MGKLSIIIPVYNEEDSILLILDRLHSLTLIDELEKEIIIVNDGCTDTSEEKILDFVARHPNANINYHVHEKNAGKGAALQTGFAQATGEITIIQDADLEYDPDEYEILLRPILSGQADVVYGSRFMGGKPHRILFFWHSIGNKFLTMLSNMFTNLNLTDMETCYKMFRTDLIHDMKLKEKRFGVEPEITAKFARIPNVRIYEVGISYYGRTYQEGKKINWRDGFRAIYCIVRYNVFR